MTEYKEKRLAEKTRQGNLTSPATVNRETSTLKKALKLAVDNDKLHKVPVIKRLTEPPARSGFLYQKDYEALLKKLPTLYHNALTFAYVTGWRVSEVLGLTWAQITTDEIRLSPEQTKTNEGRSFPWSSSATLKAVIDEQR